MYCKTACFIGFPRFLPDCLHKTCTGQFSTYPYFTLDGLGFRPTPHPPKREIVDSRAISVIDFQA